MLSVGNVVEVWVPDDARGGPRSSRLDDAPRGSGAASSGCLGVLDAARIRVQRDHPGTGRRKGSWTAAHWAWIKSISFPEKADDDALAYYVDAVRQAMEDKARLERLVEAEASKPRWKRRIDSSGA